MLKKICIIVLVIVTVGFSQFGKNKVQYNKFKYSYVQSEHFDVYFSEGGNKAAAFTAAVAESALVSIREKIKYNINNRLKIIVYNSRNEFQQTNIIDEYLSEGIGGVTELYKNRIVVPFDGSYSQLKHVVHHELVHAVMNDMIYGGSIQSVVSNNITINMPLWFSEGLAEYLALGWDVHSDMYLRDVTNSGRLPDIQYIDGYMAYRGGQSIMWYIERKYGKEKVGEFLNKVKGSGGFESGLKNTLGISIKELSEQWQKDQKYLYWPDVAKYKEPPDFAKQLTDHTKDGGFYNTSPAVSPQGDKLAFISNRDDYFDVFIMSLKDNKIIKKLVKGNRTSNFEELNILTPGLTWSPDGKKIAISAKAGSRDALFIFDVETGDEEKCIIDVQGISSVAWSPLGNAIAFIGQNDIQSDVFYYNLESKSLDRLTNDIFDDYQPSFTKDGKMIFFSSSRGDYLNNQEKFNVFELVNFEEFQRELYLIDLTTRELNRLTYLPESNEYEPIAIGKNGIMFISDKNGINNIYYAELKYNDTTGKLLTEITEKELKAVTNSMNGIFQISVSNDDKKLVFSSIYKSAYDLFLMNNPIDRAGTIKDPEETYYIKDLRRKPEIADTINQVSAKKDSLNNGSNENIFVETGNITDSSRVFNQTSRTDFSGFIFGERFRNVSEDKKDSLEIVKDGKDENGEYIVKPYKISFSPDLVYANAGYSTFYGLLGTAMLSFSDLMGDHRILAYTSMQIDLKNSDYGVAYYYLPLRTDFGISGFHTARFLYLSASDGYSYIYRFRNYGAVFNFSYPVDRFYRIDGGISWTNLRKENLEIPEEEISNTQLVVPSVSFVHDNSLWGYTSPVRGSRYSISLMGVPGFGKNTFNFGSVTADYRTYFKISDDYSFGFRASGGYSFGRNPQKFMLGGTENWINREFQYDSIPITSVEDFLFLSPVYPMRGYNYGQQLGTKYLLMNFELRYPLIKFLMAGPLPILFQNVLGTAFVDVGSSWINNENFKGLSRDAEGNLYTRDILVGTGFGARIFLGYFLLKIDVAWSYNIKSFSEPKYYFSLGTDF